MRLKLISEDQILESGFRQAIIKEITGLETGANVQRKRQDQRKHEVYRDQIKKWVIESLIHENLRPETIRSMQNRAANISICKKIVNKLAQSYTHGVTRSVAKDETSQTAIDKLTKEMDWNSKMKKIDRYIQLFKNTMLQVVPERDTRTSTLDSPKFRLKMKAIPPYLYDVIEDNFDHEKPRVVILTDFTERDNLLFETILHGGDGRSGRLINSPRFFEGNRKEEAIADAPQDEGVQFRTFIWWSDKYHFTTNSKGTIIPMMSGGFDPISGEATLLNPIEILPFINFSEDQDGSFWSQSGEDLIEGSILINKLLTDMYAIAYVQGWGQGVLIGKDVPKFIEGGPHNWMVLGQDSTDDPRPSFEFISANPPLETWMRMIEQLTALLLSTNNLSVKAVAGKLDVASMASGIALLIEQAESTADMQDRQMLFKDQEPIAWEITRRWQNMLFERKALIDDFMEIGSFKSSDVLLDFITPMQIVTETDKLATLRARKDLGLNTMVQLIQKDNPSLTEKEAEDHLLKIQTEKMNRLSAAVNQFAEKKGNKDGDNVQETKETSEEKEEVTDAESKDTATNNSES